MFEKYDLLTQRKFELDKLHPLPDELIKNLEEWFRVELTYSSNAIEGNTLTRAETAMVVEKGITVEGKTLNEHLEAINHAEALGYIKGLVGKNRRDITIETLLTIHRIMLKKIDDENAGQWRTVDVRIVGSTGVVLPGWQKIAELMEQFVQWLHAENNDHPVKIAADAHLKFVSIHPFVDGNGRTARLLMNLLLMQQGYAPALIRKEDRGSYIKSIEKAQNSNELSEYYNVIHQAEMRSLNIYLKAGGGKSFTVFKLPTERETLKIGQLAKQTNETTSTIRFWTSAGLLNVIKYSDGGYRLYDESMLDRVREIQKLKNEQRLTIVEIKERLENVND